MLYNLKLTEYPENYQVSYYSKKIIRGDTDEKDTTDDKLYSWDKIKNHWFNNKTGKMEVIPRGYEVVINPFSNEECLQQILSDEELEKEKIKNTYRNLRRTKQNIYEIVRGSYWDIFVTLTISDTNIRFDLDECKKRVSKRINNIKNKFCKDLKYVLIFEKHPTSKAWHCHGLFNNIDGLSLIEAMNPHTNKPIIKNNRKIYNIKEFDTLGFSTASFVDDNNKVTRYILKYITKEMAFEFPGKHAYLCSKGLPRGIEKFIDIESEQMFYKVLESELGYVPVLTHSSVSYNYYNDSVVKYLQFKKEVD